jgi:hypothetical protein
VVKDDFSGGVLSGGRSWNRCDQEEGNDSENPHLEVDRIGCNAKIQQKKKQSVRAAG